MITASHNPKEYNDYKARADGVQFVVLEDAKVPEEVSAIQSIKEV